jgi:hypothetical protein
MTRRRRPEKRTIVETPPTMAELAAEATARVFVAPDDARAVDPVVYRLGEGGKAPAPFSGPVLCGWCVRREGPQAKREHRRCDFDRCECFCRSERSADVTQPIAVLITETPGVDEHTRAALAKRGEWGPSILENPELRRAVRDLDIAEKAASIFLEPAEDPREGSGVRDAISQDPGLAGLLEGL